MFYIFAKLLIEDCGILTPASAVNLLWYVILAEKAYEENLALHIICRGKDEDYLNSLFR